MAEIDYDDMCPNCVTPWKCNGPHESPAETAPEPREDVADSEVRLTDDEREVLRIKGSVSGMDAVILYVERIIAERVRAAAVEALREAADEIDASVGSEPVLMHVVDWVDGVEYAARRVRDRADRRAER